jgi:hypothetical protein
LQADSARAQQPDGEPDIGEAEENFRWFSSFEVGRDVVMENNGGMTERVDALVTELRRFSEQSPEAWIDLREAVFRLNEEREPKQKRGRPNKCRDRKAEKKTEQDRLRQRNRRARLKGLPSRTGCNSHPVKRSTRCVTCHDAATNPFSTSTTKKEPKKQPKKQSKKEQREELKELLDMKGRRLSKIPSWLRYSENERIVDPLVTEDEKRMVFERAWFGLQKKDEGKKEICFGIFRESIVNQEMLDLFAEALQQYHAVNRKVPDQYKTSARTFFSRWYGGVKLKSSAGSPVFNSDKIPEAIRFLWEFAANRPMTA